MARMPIYPLVAIVGATGTGKSELAVEIARRFDGEIINGDAMQLYRGLPIITNKVTPEETRGVPHHLLGRIELAEETWTVGKFVNTALQTMDEIRGRGKLPILVGGTHYYIQSLLFQDAMSEEAALTSAHDNEPLPILDEPTSVILAKLQEVDPVMAGRWHPNERRKIQRSLEIYLRTGRPASEIYDDQRTRRDRPPEASDGRSGSNRSGLRFPTLLLWVHTNKDVLHLRLDGRVDKMLEKGLLQEVETLTDFKHQRETDTGRVVDQTRGIWVSIGYKEFLEYEAALSRSNLLAKELEQVKEACVAKTQAATRQYANRQIKWIRIKLLNAFIAAKRQENVFLLDGSDLSQWTENVVQPALKMTRKFMAGEDLPPPSSLSTTAAEMLTPKRDYDLGQRPDLWQKRVCDTCGTIAVTENDWKLHVKSRAHRRAVGAEKKLKNINGRLDGRQTSESVTSDVLEGYVNVFGDGESTT
ncbi:tRNA isopentenyltransferas-like protein [Setomelanomma holmii]|uniref:tRNA dimethylallyltransferase n=1 Tax=Setomelanomma holmii TaxID=210430 RepID=A0A9P4H9Z8_9PLEO|nr:tRNA isopentenyltransferas-like protein [Setomelanomma holmii]